jgi:hypothetical protein
VLIWPKAILARHRQSNPILAGEIVREVTEVLELRGPELNVRPKRQPD